MGFFEKIFKRPAVSQGSGYFKTFSAYAPAFTSFGGSIYESELVRAAIQAKANHISKMAVRIDTVSKPIMRDTLKRQPNSWQTWSQFLAQLSTITDVQNTAFIVPVTDDFGGVTGICPLVPASCTVQDYNGIPFLRYRFQNGQVAAMEMSRCGVVTKFQYDDAFFGASNKALMSTMDLINIQAQGIQEGVKSAATFRFMAKLNNFAKATDLAGEQKKFTEANMRADNGGVLLFPNTWQDVQQIKSAPYVVDAEQMRIINENVYRYFGTNEDVLQNKATGDAWDAYYEGAIEPFAIQLSEVLTRMLFSEDERDAGDHVTVTTNRLQYMSVKDKIAFAREMGDRGFVTVDEVRDVFNLPLLGGDEGNKMPIRGEYYNNNKEEESNGTDQQAAEQAE